MSAGDWAAATPPILAKTETGHDTALSLGLGSVKPGNHEAWQKVQAEHSHCLSFLAICICLPLLIVSLGGEI